MKSDMLRFLTLHRQIFGICPHCGEFFRLSDCRIFLRRKALPDWLDDIRRQNQRLGTLEQRLKEKEEELRERGREKGRRLAQSAVQRIDRVFAPRRLNPDDAKVIFHPIDYVVFNGKTMGSIENIVLLDGRARGTRHRTIQKSVERAVECGNYEWQTLRVQEDGKIKVE